MRTRHAHPSGSGSVILGSIAELFSALFIGLGHVYQTEGSLLNTSDSIGAWEVVDR